MSVITHFEVSSDTDIVSVLKDRGVLTKTLEYEGVEYEWVDEKPVPKQCKNFKCKLVLPELCPEYWAHDIELLKKNGVQTLSKLDLDFGINEYLKSLRRAGDKTDYAYYKEKRGKYTEDGFVPFTAEELEKLEAGGRKMLELWKPYDEHWNRRDLTEEEVKDFETFNIDVSSDGKRIWWIRNYATWFDTTVADYIAKALAGTKLHLFEEIEGDVIYDGDADEKGQWSPMASNEITA